MNLVPCKSVYGSTFIDEKIGIGERPGFLISLTFEVPRLELVEIHFPDDVQIDRLVRDLLSEVIVEKLLIGGMKPEAWWNGSWLSVARHHHINAIWKEHHTHASACYLTKIMLSFFFFLWDDHKRMFVCLKRIGEGNKRNPWSLTGEKLNSGPPILLHVGSGTKLRGGRKKAKNPTH